jgi:D-xylonolactonase
MAELETLASGFGLLEGPRCDERNRLYFSDVPNGGVYRRSPDGKVETLIPKRRGVGGIALNESGGIVCTGRGLIYWNEATRISRDLFVEWEGRKLNGLNDLQPDDYGSIFVGSLEHNALEEGAKRIPGSLFRVDPDGKVTKLFEGVETTNGMGFSPNRKYLYHADSTTKAVWVYDVQADRTVKDRRVFARMPQGWPDGLAIDAEGGVVVAIVNYGAGQDGHQPDLRGAGFVRALHRYRRQHGRQHEAGDNFPHARGDSRPACSKGPIQLNML